MAKRIQVGVPGVRLNETMHAVLRLIACRAREASGLACEPVQVPLRDFAQEAGVTQSSTIRAAHALGKAKLIVITPVWYDDGSQCANAYSLTALGIEVLRLADIAIAEGRVGTYGAAAPHTAEAEGC